MVTSPFQEQSSSKGNSFPRKYKIFEFFHLLLIFIFTEKSNETLKIVTHADRVCPKKSDFRVPGISRKMGYGKLNNLK